MNRPGAPSLNPDGSPGVSSVAIIEQRPAGLRRSPRIRPPHKTSRRRANKATRRITQELSDRLRRHAPPRDTRRRKTSRNFRCHLLLHKLSKNAGEPGAETPDPPQPLNGLKQPHRRTCHRWGCLNSLRLWSLLREAGKETSAFLSGKVIVGPLFSAVKQSGQEFFRNREPPGRLAENHLSPPTPAWNHRGPPLAVQPLRNWSPTVRAAGVAGLGRVALSCTITIADKPPRTAEPR